MEIKNSLTSPELLPTKDSERDISLLDFTLLWSGMTINIAGFAIGAQLYPGLSPMKIIYAILVAYLMVTGLLVLTGDIGIKYGIPFAVYTRACFGYKGSYIAGFIRAIPCFFWFGFQTWVGAIALNEVMKMLVGYSNVTLLIILFGAIQIINAIYGLKAMAKFDWIAIPTLAIVLGAMMFWLLKTHNVTIVDILATPGDNTAPFSFAVMGIAGGWITMALNSPDLTRSLKRSENYENQTFFQRNKNSIIAQILGLVLVGTAILLVGMTAGILTGTWNPIDVVIESFGSSKPVVLAFCFLTIVFAQWSTNTAANLLPPAYIMLNIFPKLNFVTSTIISGIIGIVILPWKFGNYLVQFQAITSGLLGPIVGIMITDYYIIRKQKLNVKDLYEEGGQYTYKNNFNPAGMISLFISFGIAMIFSDYAFFIGFGLSVVLYIVLMRTMVLNKYDQKIGQHIPFD
ncbi:cytosine permease [Clostridium sp. MSJ-11]|uniref:Cytosine permease n=1 Tax=Clostridium mobile TaxID=2841512 RepID=A0ABS6EJA5_9CLOT|nr:cytosine permease [Clostridium mobile]MBU5485295.1 cytosine permease [Clostridium mobile]